MYIDYKILKLLKSQEKLSMPGTDLLNTIFPMENLVFSQKVLEQMIADGLIRGGVNEYCALTPKGCLAFLELEAKRTEQEKQLQQFKKAYIQSWIAIALSVLSLIGTILIQIISWILH